MIDDTMDTVPFGTASEKFPKCIAYRGIISFFTIVY